MSMSRFNFVDRKAYPHLYHWQKFVPEHLETLLRNNKIWFSRPDTFNDPWDCKPCFATDFVNDPEEIERYIQDYADITRRQRSDIPESIIAQRQSEFRANPALLAQKVAEITRGMWPEIAERYRVYCLGPDPGNLLMWSHYADNHRAHCGDPRDPVKSDVEMGRRSLVLNPTARRTPYNWSFDCHNHEARGRRRLLGLRPRISGA